MEGWVTKDLGILLFLHVRDRNPGLVESFWQTHAHKKVEDMYFFLFWQSERNGQPAIVQLRQRVITLFLAHRYLPLLTEPHPFQFAW